MKNTIDFNKLLKPDFDYRSFPVNGVIFGEEYLRIELENVDDIYVAGEVPGMTLPTKLDQLNHARGFIHDNRGFSFEIENRLVKSVRFTQGYLENQNSLTKDAVEAKLGSAEREITDVWDFDTALRILVYSRLKLYFHIDAETNEVTEIRFGDIDETEYHE